VDNARVIMQTYTPEQYAIQAAAQHSYANFYAQEVAFRQQYAYPPFSKLIKLVYQHENEQKAKLETESMAFKLKTDLLEVGLNENDFDFIGPAPSFQRKLRNYYRYQFIVRLRVSENAILGEAERSARRIISTLRYQRLRGWTVDVDPQNVL
jgi:primosomal protein N' (replication factor Y)